MRARPTWQRAVTGRAVVGVALALAAACAPGRHAPTRIDWAFGQDPGDLRPWAVPDAATTPLRRLLYRGLVDQDSAGRIVPAAAERWDATPDSLTWTFELRPGLVFADGTPCQARDFRAAFLRGLRGPASGSAQWLLWSVQGVDHWTGRSGEDLPGVQALGSARLRLVLSRPDPLLLRKLVHPLCAPVSPSDGDTVAPAGLGPYRRVGYERGRQLLLAASTRSFVRAAFDTLSIDLGVRSPRMRAAFRAGRYEIVWPVPAGLPASVVPAPYRERMQTSPMWLLVAFRCDLPPTLRPAARRALAHALNRPALLSELAERGAGASGWPAPALAPALPPFDRDRVREWMAVGKLGRSLHVALGFARGSAGEEVAQAVQADWAAQSLDAELHPQGPAALVAALRGGGPHVLLVEEHPLIDDPSSRVAAVIRSPRGFTVGAYRTGWNLRGFDDWLWPRRARRVADPAAVRRELEGQLPVIPIARLPWLWIERQGGPRLHFDPFYGPDFTLPGTPKRGSGR